MFHHSYVARLVADIRARGNKPGIVREWREQMEEWVLSEPPTNDKLAAAAWLPFFQVRPFYTAGELAPMMPALAVMLGYERRWPHQKSPNRLANELDFAGLPKLENSKGGFYFHHPVSGHVTSFFIVERLHHWRDHPLTQSEVNARIKGEHYGD